ncbi:CapA family protein [Bradyrhizobium sp. TZ2]
MRRRLDGSPVFCAERGLVGCRAELERSGLAKANNHILDAGHEDLIDTLNPLHSQEIGPVGTAANLAELRRPRSSSSRYQDRPSRFRLRVSAGL